MTIDEAIEITNNVLPTLDYRLEEAEKAAIKLGIEALKRRKYESERTSRWADMSLPGETKD